MMANACLFSGGKDSTLALHKARASGINIDLLLTMLPENKASYMFHYPNLRFAEMQAEAMGISHRFFNTEGKKEEELKDLEKALKENGVDLLVTGATYSRYQFERIGAIAKRLGIENLAPLWHIDPLLELNELSRDFNAIVTSVSAEGFDDSFLGARIDQLMISKLIVLNQKYSVNMLFEGGEAESFVLDAPLFKKRIEVTRSRKEWEGMHGMFVIEEARLAGKE